MPHRTAWVLLATLSWASFSRADKVVEPTADDFKKSNVLERLARRMEPDLVGQPQRLRQYIDFFQTEVGNDKRLFAFEVRSEPQPDGKVKLYGHIEFPETRAALVEYLSILGFTVEDQLEALPASSLGDTIFGIVKVPHSLSYDKPGDGRRAETDCLIGEPLYLLREENGHLLAHSGDGYLGYVRADDVILADKDTLARYLEGPRVRLLVDYKSPQGNQLPAGARLKLIDKLGNVVHAYLPTGETVSIPVDKCEVSDKSVADTAAIIARAKLLLGTKYKWGGRSSEGVDCSGLVQLAYSAVGVHLPRDSYQQIYTGKLSATRWHRSGLQPGDTLYFLGEDGKIRHTGLYLGDDRFIQAVVPVVRISSLNPQHEEYDLRHAKSFAFAKRPVE